MTEPHGHRLCVVSQSVADGARITHVLFDDEPVNADDSGFVVLSDDVDLDDDGIPIPSDDPTGFEVLCLHCLLDAHPEAGPRLEAARRTGHWTAR